MKVINELKVEVHNGVNVSVGRGFEPVFIESNKDYPNLVNIRIGEETRSVLLRDLSKAVLNVIRES